MTVFGQLFTGLKAFGFSGLRGIGQNGTQPWNVDLVGEGSIDVGGAYRETLTLACYDLMQGTCPLFIHCPNGVNGVGLNRCVRGAGEVGVGRPVVVVSDVAALVGGWVGVSFQIYGVVF